VIMFRRNKAKNSKEIQLVGIRPAQGDPQLDERTVAKTSSAVKARRRASRSLSLNEKKAPIKYHRNFDSTQSRGAKLSQPDLLKEAPVGNGSSKPVISETPDGDLQLVAVKDDGQAQDTEQVHTANYTLKIVPCVTQTGDTAIRRSSQNGRSKYRHSTYIPSSTQPKPVLRKSMSQEKIVIEEEVLHFDDVVPKRPPGGKGLDPVNRDRTGTDTSMLFDVSYEL